MPASVDVKSLMISSVRMLENGRHLCLICEKTNKQRASMQRHMREIHLKCEQYRCPSCSVLYGSRSVFYHHIHKMHNEFGTNLDDFRVK